MSTTLIDQHIAKLRVESALIGGVQRKGCFVPGPHFPMFLTHPDTWGIAHIPSARQLVPGGLTQREAFSRAMDLYDGGRGAGLVMGEPLAPQLAALAPEDLARMTPAARAYIETLRTLLIDALEG